MKRSSVTRRRVGPWDGAWFVSGDGGSSRPVRQGKELAKLQPSWSAVDCLDFGGEAFLLLLSSTGGWRAAWVLDLDLRFVCDLASLNSDISPDIYRIVREEATIADFRLKLEILPTQNNLALLALMELGGNVFSEFLALSDATPVSRSVEELINLGLSEATGQNRSFQIRYDALVELLNLSHEMMIPSVRAGRITLPGLTQDEPADSVFLICREGLHPTYACYEASTDFRYYIIFRASFPTTVYIPCLEAYVSASVSAAFDIASIAHYLDSGIRLLSATLIQAGVKSLPKKQIRLGLFTSGILNFGHAIWDEMQALEALLEVCPNGSSPIDLFFVERQSGLDMYAPIEELYPEFTGHVHRFAGENAALAAAASKGCELVLRSGQRARLGSRRRLIRLAGSEVDPQLRSLSRSVFPLNGKAARPILTLGIRLTNRYATNLLEFYRDLVLEIYRQLGPMVVVLDGINGSAETGKAATYIYNASKGSDFAPEANLKDGSVELAQELDWVSLFCDSFKRADVEIINCVGMPIIENLYWLGKSSFFVAPLGGGLAKLRWANDVPGFVLSSQVNLTQCSLLRAYDDEAQMDRPFTDLHYNTADDVADLPLDPPRSTSAGPSGIPHPENFVILADRLLVRVAELAVNALMRSV